MSKQSLRTISTPTFRLKMREGRMWQAISLKKQFDFMPDIIIVERIGKNEFKVRAIVPEELIAKNYKEQKEAIVKTE